MDLGCAWCFQGSNPTVTSYAQVQKELLVIVFRVEGFEGSVYGKEVFIETDHKPLERIMKKSLLSSPKQKMLLRQQKFDRKKERAHMYKWLIHLGELASLS